MNIYHDKYKKYKNKYIRLKQSQSGGDITSHKFFIYTGDNRIVHNNFFLPTFTYNNFTSNSVPIYEDVMLKFSETTGLNQSYFILFGYIKEHDGLIMHYTYILQAKILPEFFTSVEDFMAKLGKNFSLSNFVANKNNFRNLSPSIISAKLPSTVKFNRGLQKLESSTPQVERTEAIARVQAERARVEASEKEARAQAERAQAERAQAERAQAERARVEAREKEARVQAERARVEASEKEARVQAERAIARAQIEARKEAIAQAERERAETIAQAERERVEASEKEARAQSRARAIERAQVPEQTRRYINPPQNLVNIFNKFIEFPKKIDQLLDLFSFFTGNTTTNFSNIDANLYTITFTENNRLEIKAYYIYETQDTNPLQISIHEYIGKIIAKKQTDLDKASSNSKFIWQQNLTEFENFADGWYETVDETKHIVFPLGKLLGQCKLKTLTNIFKIDDFHSYFMPRGGGNRMICDAINFLKQRGIQIDKVTVEPTVNARRAYINQGFERATEGSSVFNLNFDKFNKKCIEKLGGEQHNKNIFVIFNNQQNPI
jgi:hypothetical protein